MRHHLTAEICEYVVGLRIKLVMLETMLSKAYRGEPDSFFHSGVSRKAFHLAVRSVRSVNEAHYPIHFYAISLS